MRASQGAVCSGKRGAGAGRPARLSLSRLPAPCIVSCWQTSSSRVFRAGRRHLQCWVCLHPVSHMQRELAGAGIQSQIPGEESVQSSAARGTRVRVWTARAHCCDVSWGHFPEKGIMASTTWVFCRPASGSYFQLASMRISHLMTLWPDAGEAQPALTERLSSPAGLGKLPVWSCEHRAAGCPAELRSAGQAGQAQPGFGKRTSWPPQ